MTSELIIKRIKAFRESKKITPKEIASKLFIGTHQYYRIERGGVSLSIDRFLQICRILDVSPCELLENLNMNVNINNLRIQLANSFNALCKELNDSIVDKYSDPVLYLSPDDIKKHMDDLRMRIVEICCCYNQDVDDFADVSDEVGGFEVFNP